MKIKQSFFLPKLFLASGIIWLVAFLAPVSAAQVTLQWDANDPAPDGYRLFQRQEGASYDYTAPVWAGTANTCVVTNLTPGVSYNFVVRAFNEEDESGDSNEVQYTPPVDTGSVNPDNAPPERPVLSQPANGAQGVSTTPVLMTEAFVDPDFDGHARTCYQISTTSDFSSLVFDRTFTQHLTSLKVPDLILDPETTYYWRVKFYDDRNGESEWSDAFQFETIDYADAGDANGNGIIDSQEIDQSSDIDGDGIPDASQAGLQEVVTPEANDLKVAVKRIGGDVQVDGMVALDTQDMPSAVNQPAHLSGVVSFRLLLLNDASTATVQIYLSQPAPSNAKWYNYDPDEGWTPYADAVFSSDRRSVTLILEDGGSGDQDGVRNGIIVDPSGLGYTSETTTPSTYTPMDANGSSGCFIGTSRPLRGNWGLGVLLLLPTIVSLVAKIRLSKKPHEREQ